MHETPQSFTWIAGEAGLWRPNQMCFHWMTKQLHRPSDTPMLLMVLLSHVHLYAGYACVCEWWWKQDKLYPYYLSFIHVLVVVDDDGDDGEPVLHLLTDANSPHKDRLADRHLKPTPKVQIRCYLDNKKDTENNRACVTHFLYATHIGFSHTICNISSLCHHQTNECACCSA